MSMENTKMRTQPVSKLLWSLAIPAICAQLVTLLYNLVDRIFIGQMEDGMLAMAAIGICTPVITIITAFTHLFGRGGAPLAAIQMGRNNTKKAEDYLGNSFAALILTSVTTMVVVFCFKKSILYWFGASDATLPFALDYLSIYIFGTRFIQLTVGMNDYITTQGFARTAMITTMTGALCNVVLDPLFIFVFKMGVRGAALATVLAQMISFLWVMRFLFGRQTRLHLSFRTIRFQPGLLKEIVGLGASPFFMSLSEGVLVVCFNTQALKLGGDVAVSAIAILFSLFQFLLLPVEGVSQGAQPILSYNYGARQYDRVMETIRLSLKTTLAFTMLATCSIVLFPGFFIRLFGSDPDLIRLGSPMLQIYIGGCFVLGANSTFQQTYNALGEGKCSFFFAFYRKAILLIPLIYTLPAMTGLGIFGLVLAEPVSDLLTTFTNALYFRTFIHKKLEEQNVSEFTSQKEAKI